MPQIIPTAQRVLQVFEVYARERRPLTNSEMARMLDLADSSCSDLLYTLRQAGYLLRTPKSRYFHPTGRLLDVAQGIAAADPLQAFAGEALEILTRQSGESSMCGLLDGNKVKIYASQESRARCATWCSPAPRSRCTWPRWARRCWARWARPNATPSSTPCSSST